MRLLVTRPEPDAERTAAALRARGHEVLVSPLLRIEPVPDAVIGPGPFAALLVTSANVAPAIAAHARFAQLRSLPVFAVGDRSAEALRAAGFAGVTSAHGGVDDLAALATSCIRPGGSLLYLAGADRSGDLAGVLSGRGFAVSTVVIYRAGPVTALSPIAAAAIEVIDGVLHFSRRSAEMYLTAARAGGVYDDAIKPMIHFCMSAQVAEPLIRAGATDVRVAQEPSESTLLSLIPPP
jgi:uroporphyrinogen-III synthase